MSRFVVINRMAKHCTMFPAAFEGASLKFGSLTQNLDLRLQDKSGFNSRRFSVLDHFLFVVGIYIIICKSGVTKLCLFSLNA